MISVTATGVSVSPLAPPPLSPGGVDAPADPVASSAATAEATAAPANRLRAVPRRSDDVVEAMRSEPPWNVWMFIVRHR